MLTHIFYPVRRYLPVSSNDYIGHTTAVSTEYDFGGLPDPLTFAYSCYIIRWRLIFVEIVAKIENFCATAEARPPGRAPITLRSLHGVRNAGFLRFPVAVARRFARDSDVRGRSWNDL